MMCENIEVNVIFVSNTLSYYSIDYSIVWNIIIIIELDIESNDLDCWKMILKWYIVCVRMMMILLFSMVVLLIVWWNYMIILLTLCVLMNEK